MDHNQDIPNDRIEIPLATDFTVEDLEYWGVNQLAYVKPGEVAEHKGFVIYAADGQEIGFAYDYETACAAAVQFDLYPMHVH
jgi:hypothetical protein